MAGRRGPTRREEMIMTQDKARKTATRQRMAETGEPYSVARHAVESEYSEATADDAAGNGAVGDSGGEAGLSAQERADQMRFMAEQAQERAERVRERAEQANEAAMMAQEAADMAAEAANLTREWADEQEQEQAQLRAAQARAAAQEAQGREQPRKAILGKKQSDGLGLKLRSFCGNDGVVDRDSRKTEWTRYYCGSQQESRDT